MDDVVEGQVLTGTIAAMALYHGLFISIGNYWFAFVPIDETDWPDCHADFRIGQALSVRVWKVCG